MGALDQLRGANGDGMLDRARSNPWLVVAIAAGAILILAWIGWAIYVTSEHGAGAGVGVVIAWPAILTALALISLPFIGGYLLIKRLSDGDGSTATAASDPADDTAEDEEAEDDGEDEDPAEEEGQDEDDEEADDEEEDDASESDSEPEASNAS